MKIIDTDKLQKELAKLSDEKLAKFMMLLPLAPHANGTYPNWNVGVWITGIESGSYVTKKEWKKYCKEKNITTKTQWEEHSSSGKRQSNIPSDPSDYYSRYETWLGWAKELRDQDDFVTKKEWKKYCKENNITTNGQWREHSSSGKRQSNIPSEPNVYYARTETWLGWPKELRDQDEFVTKKEWKKYCKEKNITTKTQWNEHSSSGKRQSNIPSDPARYYAKTETWLGWGIELGTGNIQGRKKRK